jgi:hypothetical protein
MGCSGPLCVVKGRLPLGDALLGRLVAIQLDSYICYVCPYMPGWLGNPPLVPRIMKMIAPSGERK